VTNLPSLPIAPSRRLRTRRPTGPLLAVLALALCALFSLVGSAGAEVVTISGSTVGVTPRAGAEGPTNSKSFANPEGHPVVHGEQVFAVYWDPTDHYHGDWQQGVDEFLQLVGRESGHLNTVFSVPAQYDDKSNVPALYRDVFRGAYTDTHAYPANGCTDPEPFEKADNIGAGETPVCVTNAQVTTELSNFIASHGLPKGLGAIYYLMTPPGVTVCLDEGGAKGHCSDYEKSEESYNNSFCSYHGDVNPGGLPTGDGNTVLYGVIPFTAAGTFGDEHLLEIDERPGWECQDGGFDASNKFKLEAEPHAQEPNQIPCPTEYDGACDHGLFDMLTNQIWMQQENIVTNPLLNAWQDSHHAEEADQCRLDFAPIIGGSSAENSASHAGNMQNQAWGNNVYYLNDAFNLAGLRLPYPGVICLPGTNLVPTFTAPNAVNAGEVVGFDGMESNITQNAGINFPAPGTPAANYATYNWEFGDGTSTKGYAPGAPVCEAPWLSPCAASAFHTYTYGGTYLVTLTVTDVGGNVASVSHEVTVVGPPPPAPPAAGSKSGSGAGAVAVIVNPVAAAAIVSRSLKTALRKGLSVRYSVNEQVAGNFEVLISSALAKKLGLHGTPATGLPAGTPPQVMIARAVLVTTKAGHSTIQIKFSAHVAARLHHVHHVSLLLRMFVRNAASKSPATTTVLSSVTLGG
jgi:PKD domain